MRKRLLVLGLVCLGVAAAADAQVCQEVTKQFFGHYTINGDVICYWGGSPPQTPVVVGERYRDCWGEVWTWGDTSCEIYPPNYIYEDCSCGLAEKDREREGVPEPASCPAIDPPVATSE